ncbi:hypothetical protein D9M72_364090 [compost metagenome]
MPHLLSGTSRPQRSVVPKFCCQTWFDTALSSAPSALLNSSRVGLGNQVRESSESTRGAITACPIHSASSTVIAMREVDDSADTPSTRHTKMPRYTA